MIALQTTRHRRKHKGQIGSMLLKTGDFKVKGGLVELTDDSENPTFFLAVRLL